MMSVRSSRFLMLVFVAGVGLFKSQVDAAKCQRLSDPNNPLWEYTKVFGLPEGDVLGYQKMVKKYLAWNEQIDQCFGSVDTSNVAMELMTVAFSQQCLDTASRLPVIIKGLPSFSLSSSRVKRVLRDMATNASTDMAVNGAEPNVAQVMNAIMHDSEPSVSDYMNPSESVSETSGLGDMEETVKGKLQQIQNLLKKINGIDQSFYKNICAFYTQLAAPCFTNRILPALISILNESQDGCCNAFKKDVIAKAGMDIDAFFRKLVPKLGNLMCSTQITKQNQKEVCGFSFVQTMISPKVKYPVINVISNVLRFFQIEDRQVCRAFAGESFMLTNNIRFNKFHSDNTISCCGGYIDDMVQFMGRMPIVQQLEYSYNGKMIPIGKLFTPGTCLNQFEIVNAILDKPNSFLSNVKKTLLRLLGKRCFHLPSGFSSVCNYPQVGQCSMALSEAPKPKSLPATAPHSHEEPKAKKKVKKVIPFVAPKVAAVETLRATPFPEYFVSKTQPQSASSGSIPRELAFGTIFFALLSYLISL